MWFGREGLFLTWPQAAGDVQALLEADQLPGIPKAPETVLELLLAAGVFERQDVERATWDIQPPESKTVLEAVKLASPSILFAGIDPAPTPLDVRLARKPGEPPTPAQTPQRSQAAPSGTQLSLIEQPQPHDGVEQPPTAVLAAAPTPPPSPPVPDSPPQPAFTLKAPLRLNPAVRAALAHVVQTLNAESSTAAACTVATGLFVPLHELERRGIQPAVALRALADVRMLIHSDRDHPPTISRDFGGAMTVGLVIDPRFIDGFDMAAFVVPEPAKD